MRRPLGWTVILFVAAVFGAGYRTLEACTAFCAVGGGQVLVGNNEDYFIPRTRSDGRGDGRFSTATAMLERAGGEISIDLFRRILDATHQSGGAPTLYSNIYELKSRTMYLYNFHDFDHVVTLRLDDELKKGERVIDIKSLFPPNPAAEKFAADRPASPLGLPGGLSLTPATCEFEALVVDHIRRDAALVLLDHAAWLTRGAPAVLQPHLSRMLTIR